MSFEELIQKVRQVKSDHQKIEEADFFETVIAWKELALLSQILKEYFGQPWKAADVWPADEMIRVTAPYGGIRQNQTLYYADHTQSFSMAMLWPWADGMLITVKLMRGKKTEEKAASTGIWDKIKNLFG